MDQVVILARGLGTRMRKSDPAVALDPALAAAADSGVKAMIPIGRPFLDYVLGVAADAGITRACLVVGPEHGQIQKYYTELRPRRMTIEFAVQVQPLGTADAVAAAEQVVGQRPFLMINSDNYYPLQALCGLRDASGAGRGDLRPGYLGGGKQHRRPSGSRNSPWSRGSPRPTAPGACSGSSRSPTKPRWPDCRGRWA